MRGDHRSEPRGTSGGSARDTSAKVLAFRRRDAVTQGAAPVGEPGSNRSNRGDRTHATDYLPHLNDARRAAYWAKVEKRGRDECWPWMGAKSGRYGRLKVDGGSRPAHCVGWVIQHDREIPAGLYVDHDPCNNPECQNPSHFQLKTRTQNLERRATARSTRIVDEQAFRARARAHWAGFPLEPLGDAAAGFLEWHWRAMHDRRGWPTAEIGRAEVNALGRLLSSTDERTAFRALEHAFRSWGRFAAFAARKYGLWFGRVERAPERPVLSALKTDGISALLAFWCESDEARERALLERAHGAGAWARRREIVAEWCEELGMSPTRARIVESRFDCGGYRVAERDS